MQDKEMSQLVKMSAASTRSQLDMSHVMDAGLRARRLRTAGFSLLAGVVLVASVLFAGNFLPLGDRAAQSSGGAAASGGGLPLGQENRGRGYEFSNVAVSRGARGPQDGKQRATITFGYQWATQDNPGVRDCVLTVFDDAGQVIGQETKRFSTTRRANPNVPVAVVIAEGASPASADIECGERLDGPGTYEFSNVRVWASPGEDYREIIVEYSASWTGSSEAAGPSDCIVTVYDREDAVLITDEIRVIAGSGSIENGVHPIDVPENFTGGEPDHAEVVCK